MSTTRKSVLNGPDGSVWDTGADWPAWVPEAARNYLAHTEGGQTIRALAREAQVAPSTILRRVRRVESSRDDPLVDAALRQLSSPQDAGPHLRDPAPALSAGAREALREEALPILRRLSEARTVLAVARDLEKGVLVREGPDGDPQRLAVVDRTVAEAMVLQEWIAGRPTEARVNRYRITAQGRAALRELLAEAAQRSAREAARPSQRPEAAGRDDAGAEDGRLRHMRSLLVESPLTALARRRDGQGAPFLGRDLVAAGERLREDFEIAEQGVAGSVNWDGLLARVAAGAPEPATGKPPQAAPVRVAQALADLGPGLADVALRCCCLLEGLEAFEARMGWSARSGKVVLRIALERLARHYREAGRFGPLIG